MTLEERRFTRIVKKHDDKLFVRQNAHNKQLEVFREGHRTASCDASDFLGPNATLSYTIPCPFYVMSLTDNWNCSGRPAMWGELPLLARLRQIDAWDRESLASRMDEINEKVDQSAQKDFVNKTEDFAYEFRNQFKKTFSDVNTSNMEKIDKRRLKENN